MNNSTRPLPIFCALLAALAVSSSSTAKADPLLITVQRTDSNFNPLSSITLNSGYYGASTNNIGLSPFLLNYLFPTAAFSELPGGVKVDPFAGTGVGWAVTAQANVPGNATEGYLQTNSLSATNSSATTYYMRVIIESGNYLLPGASGSTLLATTIFSNSGVADAQAKLTSYIDGTQIGTTTFSQPSTSLPAQTNYVRGESYRLKNVFDITLASQSPTDPSSRTNVTINTSVSAVPEAWNLVTLLAMLVPFGIYFGGRGRFVNLLS